MSDKEAKKTEAEAEKIEEAEAPEVQEADRRHIPVGEVEFTVENTGQWEPEEEIPGEPKSWYWTGLTTDCPFFNLSIGGINFQRFTGGFTSTGNKVVFVNNMKAGFFHALTDARAEFVKGAAEKRILRPTGPRTAMLLSTAGRGWMTGPDGKPLCRKPYAHEPGDAPASCFIFMIKVSRKVIPDVFAESPPHTLKTRPNDAPLYETQPLSADGNYGSPAEAWEAQDKANSAQQEYRRSGIHIRRF